MGEPHLYQVEDGWFETLKGTQFRFADPRPEMIDIEEIAHALSHLCRYNGHTSGFYSVAEHSVLIADWIARQPGKHGLALTGLLHDGAEAYIGDLPRPLKAALPDFKTMEVRIDAAVASRFGTLHPFPEIVKAADSRILVDERAQVMSDSGNEWGTDGLEPLGVTINCWSPGEARDNFLAAFRDYSRIAE